MRSHLDKFLHKAFEDQNSSLFHKVNDVLALIILVSVGLIIAESVTSLEVPYRRFFQISEWMIVGIFTVEYLIYIYLAKNKKRYIFSLFGIVDLLAILPAYLVLFTPLFAPLIGLRVLRVLRVIRLLRLFRILKLLRYNRSRVDKNALAYIHWYNLEIYFFVLFSVMVIAGTFIYLAESRVVGTPFVDIPAGMWWAIVTITTVGYGDMVPQTFLGRIVAGMTMITGLALFALLVSVMGKILQNILFGGPIDSGEREK